MPRQEQEIIEKLQANESKGEFGEIITSWELAPEGIKYRLADTIKGCYWNSFEDGSGSLKRLSDNRRILSYDFATGEYKDASGWHHLERDECALSFLEKLVAEKIVLPLDGGSIPEIRDVKKQRLFIDMDGTLAEFKVVDQIETLYEKGYFLNLNPHESVINGLKKFMENHPEIEVYVLSSVLSDSAYALSEKQAWLDNYFPEIDAAHRIFSPCGERKADYVPGGIKETDMLLDDYSDNLHSWQPPGVGIKLMNGINGTKGTWKGSRISFRLSPEVFSENLYLKIIDRQIIHDELREKFTEYKENEEDLNYAEEAIIQLRAQEDDRYVSSDEEREKDATGNEIYAGTGGAGLDFREGWQVSIRGKISGKYLDEGQISLIGLRVDNSQELAELLQCYRNPLFETARGFYLKNGYIIAAEAVSSRLPGLAAWKTADETPFAKHVNDRMQKLKADAFYMVHNHPSGNPTPSMQDCIMTKIEAQNIVGFAGHIVLDHTTYAMIDKDGEYVIENVPEATGPDPLLTASIPHPLLGEKVEDTKSIARIGRMLLDDNAERTSFVAYLASDGIVREIQEISNSVIIDSKEFKDYIQGELKGSGAFKAALYTTNEDIYESITPMIEEGYFIDVFFIDNEYGMYWSQRDLGIKMKDEYIFAGTKADDLEYYRNDEELATEKELLIHRNGGKYTVVERNPREDNLEDLILIRESDGEVVWAHGWNNNEKHWLYGKYYGSNNDSLRKALTDYHKENENTEQICVGSEAVLIEVDYKGNYERFAMTRQQFSERYKEYLDENMKEPSALSGNTYEFRPMVHMWYKSCDIGSSQWNDFFTDMSCGLSESDLESGNVAEVKEDLMGALADFLPKTQIGDRLCRVIDLWESDEHKYLLGRDVSSPEFYYAKIDGRLENIIEYDTLDFDGGHPSRHKVEWDYVDIEAERIINEGEAEFGADGRRAFPHLNDEEEI